MRDRLPAQERMRSGSRARRRRRPAGIASSQAEGTRQADGRPNDSPVDSWLPDVRGTLEAHLRQMVMMTLAERIRTSVVAALIGAGAARLCTPAHFQEQERRGDVPRAQSAPDMSIPPVPSLRLRDAAADDARVHLVRRNLFEYTELQAPRPRAPITLQQPPAVVPVTVAVLETPAVAPPPLVFGYRFLGTFGPAASLIAAFASNGEVLTVREGDHIGQSFVLRRIGTRHVDVAA